MSNGVALVTADEQGNIPLGVVGVGAGERFTVSVNEKGCFLLVPSPKVDARESLAWDNPTLNTSIMKGLQQSADGDVYDLGNFS